MILTGVVRLGRDAEVRETQSGPVAKMSLVYSYGRKDQFGRRPAQWVDGSMWGDRAVKLSPFLTKGALVWVSMSDVHVEEFSRRDGSTGTKLVGRIESIEFAGGNKGVQEERAPKAAGYTQEMDDEIPF